MLHRKKANNSNADEAESRSISDERARYRSALTRLVTETALLAVFLFIVFRFFFGITVQHGNSMYPAIKDGDIIFYYRHLTW